MIRDRKCDDRCRICAVALAAVGCSVVLAACGSSGKSSTASSGDGQAAGIKFASCMRSHGIPNFPDPSGGGGIKITAGSGIDPQSPAFRSARTACAKLLPGGGLPRAVSESRKLEMLRLAECMRSHGVTNFPDPTTAPPSGPPIGGGIAFGAPGSFISIPMTLIQSPAFKQAASECNFPGSGHNGVRSAPAP